MADAAVEETRLQALASLHVLDTAPEERFDRIVRLTQRVLDFPTVVVNLVDEDRQWSKSAVGFDVPELPRVDSFCAHTVSRDGTFVVLDPVNDPLFRDNPLVTAADGLRFYAGQPLRTPDGITVGSLCLADTRNRTITEEQLGTLRLLADLVEAELARDDEVDRAGELQRNLLPQRVPDLPGYDVAGACVPVAAVGGDFFDWYRIGDSFQVVLADVMGKGVPAAIIGSGVRALMRGASRFNELPVAVNRSAQAVEGDLAETSTFVTLFAARLDPHTHVLEYVDAGHGIAGVVTAEGRAVQFESDGLPFGAPAWEPWRASSYTMQPGDTFICFSDGLLDLFPTIDDAREAARQTVVESDSARAVVERVTAYSKLHHATDDVTAVVIRRHDR